MAERRARLAKKKGGEKEINSASKILESSKNLMKNQSVLVSSDSVGDSLNGKV